MGSEEKQLYHFLGILMNASENICKISFKNGFRVSSLTYENLEDLLLCIEGDGYQYSCVYDHLFNFFEKNGRLEKYIIITNEFEKEEIDNFTDCVNNYLIPKIDILRLYKEGNIRLIWYCIHENIEEDDLGAVASVSSPYETEVYFPIDDTLYEIKNEEVEKIQYFMDSITLPLNHEYLELAYGTYQKTYDIEDINLSFLVSMIGMEVLLNPGRDEVTHRVSRNAAVLLGNDRDQAKIIFNNMKNLYGTRSRIVHGSLLKPGKNVDLSTLRNYLCDSIKQVIIINKPQDMLHKDLDIFGFGERPWIK